MSDTPPFKVLIAGGGVAALEAALALRDLGGERFELRLLAPEREFSYRPMAVREPFALSAVQRVDLREFAADTGSQLQADGLASIEAGARIAHTAAGASIAYDAALLALGARPHARFPHAITIDDRRLDELLGGLVADVDGGFVGRVAFVVPARMAWPLPIYELALMLTRRAFEMNVELAATLVTPERSPLEIFGEAASEAVARLLAERGVELFVSARCEVPDGRHVVVNPGDHVIETDRVVALPELFGPAVRGLRSDEHGFIPVDEHCGVLGADALFAAGDATDFTLKHGGIAAEQADVAATAIAALAGVAIEPVPFRPLIHGQLLTGAEPLYLSAQLTGGRGLHSEVAASVGSAPPGKIAARHLGPYLERRG
jgi:sulfide:quinone oxidoreductase